MHRTQKGGDGWNSSSPLVTLVMFGSKHKSRSSLSRYFLRFTVTLYHSVANFSSPSIYGDVTPYILAQI